MRVGDQKTEASYQSPSSFSNFVLRQETKDKIVYYLPAYLRLTVRKAHNIHFKACQAEISGTLILSIFYGGLPTKVDEEQKSKQEMKQNKEQQINEDTWFVKQLRENVAITINGQHEWRFAESSDIFVQQALRITQNEKQQYFSYIMRDTFKSDVDGNIVLTPFETLNLYTEFSLRSILCKAKENDKSIEIRFNLMDTENKSKLVIKIQKDTGQYAVAQNMCTMVYRNGHQKYNKNDPNYHDNTKIVEESMKQILQIQQKEKKLQFWQYAHVKIVLFKQPITSIISIMIPMWVLAILVQLSFFQSNNFGDTIGSVGIALIAYMSFIPTVRQKIPPSTDFTYIEGIIVLLLLTSMLRVIRGFHDYDVGDYQYIWNQDGFFITSLILNLLTFVATISLLIYYYIFLKVKYSAFQNSKIPQFKRIDWKNLKADQYFKGKVLPILQEKDKKKSQYIDKDYQL